MPLSVHCMIAHHCSTELMYSTDTNASSYLSHSHLHTNKQNGRQSLVKRSFLWALKIWIWKTAFSY